MADQTSSPDNTEARPRPDGIGLDVVRAVSRKAEMMRAGRARRAAGLVVFKVTIHPGLLSGVLIDEGVLEEWDAEDLAAIEAALNKYLKRRVTE